MRNQKTKRRRSAHERRQILTELEASGATLVEFSLRSGIPVGTLSCWRWQARQEVEQRPSLIGVDVVDDHVGENPAPSLDPRITIETPSGHRVTLPSSTAPEALVTLRSVGVVRVEKVGAEGMVSKGVRAAVEARAVTARIRQVLVELAEQEALEVTA